MVSFEEFKESLGTAANGLSDKEIQERNEDCAKLARAIFDDCYLPPRQSVEFPEQEESIRAKIKS